jgi:single-strand DNA-binding protein
MINKVILIGNLGKDPEVRTLESGAVVAKFSVATNENYRDKNGEWQKITEWHDIVMWRALAERAQKTLTKGKLVYIEGKLTHRKWTDNNNIERYSTEIVANTFRLLERRDVMGGHQESGTASPQATPNPMKTEMNSVAQDAAGEEDDLPF